MPFHFETQNPGEAVPSRIDRYSVIQRLSSGSFGTVYFVRADGSDAPLALKVFTARNIPPQLRRSAAARFQAEALISNRVNHPGVIKIVDAGTDNEGNYFIAMEYLPGVSFRRHFEHRLDALRRNELSVHEYRREVSFLGYHVASAMRAAHAAGVVHRDLKPDNVLVIEDPFAVRQLRTKVLDFGIAKLPPEVWMALRAVGFTVQLTADGSFMGTPPYMAPEQWGAAAEATDRADVYALGMMLLEANTLVDLDQLAQPETVLAEWDGPSQWKVLLASMLAHDVQLRPEMDEVTRTLQALAQAQNDFAEAVLAWEQSGRISHCTGSKLHRFLGWAEGQQLTEGEAEFLRSSAVADVAAERQATTARLNEEHRLREQAEALAQQAREQQIAEKHLNEQQLANARSKRVALLVALALTAAALALTLAQWKSSADARDVANIARMDAERARDEANRSRKQLEDAIELNRQTTDGLVAARSELESADRRIKSVNGKLDELETSKLGAEERATQVQKVADELRSTANYLSGVRQKLEAQVADLQAQVDNLRSANARLKREVDDARAEASRLAAELANANVRIGELERDVTRLTAEVQKAQRERDTLRGDVTRLNGEVTTLSAERDAARAEQAAASRRADKLQDELNRCNQRPTPEPYPPPTAGPGEP